MLPNIIEISELVGLREVGHCILRPTCYFYPEI